MAFLQYNLPSSSVTGDVSEPTGNYHNKNSIHKLTAAHNFLLPFASKSHSHDAAIRTIAQEEVKGELRKQGLTSLGDGISRTPARRALLGCGEHTDTTLAIPALELEPQPHWDCLVLTAGWLRPGWVLCLPQLPLEITNTAKAANLGCSVLGSPRRPACGSC